MHLLSLTCRFQLEGLEEFCSLAKNEKCILMLWHNRLALVPFILSRFTPYIHYAAVVSGSRDGEILSKIIHSFEHGNTIRVHHQSRHEALRLLIRHVEEKKSVVIITPDGPRGPRYEMKPGTALAALETQAYVVSLNWEAKSFWELKTWDRMRLPKPFTTIRVRFHSPLRFDSNFTLNQTKELLKESLIKEFVIAKK